MAFHHSFSLLFSFLPSVSWVDEAFLRNKKNLRIINIFYNRLKLKLLGSNPFYIFLVFRTNSRAVSMFLASSCSWFQDVFASYCVQSIKYISSRKVKKFLPLRKWLAFPNQMSARSQLSLFIGYITKKTMQG
jgi:hypothetical protein